MSDPVSFTISDIPPDSTNSRDRRTGPDETVSTAVTSDDPTCVVCGVPLSYAGRGAKPKYCNEHKKGSRSTGTSRRSGKDVDAAMAALDSTHTTLSFLLMLAAPDAAIKWNGQKDALDDRNRRILEADPALAKRLASVAAKGGAPALVLSHLIAVAPAAGIVYGKYRDNRLEKREEAESYDYGTDTVFGSNADAGTDPDAAFRHAG